MENTKSQSEQYAKLLKESAGELDITEETDVSKHFTAQEWSIIQKEARLYGVPSYLHKYIPLGLIVQLVTSPKCDRQTSRFLDANIERLASRNKKPVGSLDNVKMLVKQDLSNPWPEKDMIQFIKLEIPRMNLRPHHIETTIQMYLLDRVTTYLEFSDALTRSYLPKKLARLMNEDFHRSIIVDRNKYWMKTLAPSLTQGNAVVAFGAAHLSGKQGVLRLLQQRGFKIEALAL